MGLAFAAEYLLEGNNFIHILNFAIHIWFPFLTESYRQTNIRMKSWSSNCFVTSGRLDSGSHTQQLDFLLSLCLPGWPPSSCILCLHLSNREPKQENCVKHPCCGVCDNPVTWAYTHVCMCASGVWQKQNVKPGPQDSCFYLLLSVATLTLLTYKRKSSDFRTPRGEWHGPTGKNAMIYIYLCIFWVTEFVCLIRN